MFEEEAVKHYENLTKSALRLNEIVKEQQQRIDKAIEYIGKLKIDSEQEYYNGETNEYEPYLEIIKNTLKGVQDERTTIE